MATFPWIVGGGALAAYLWSRGNQEVRPSAAASAPVPPTLVPPAPTTPTTASTPSPFLGNWVFPIAKWNGRKASISDGVGSPRPGGKHRGVDIMFVRKKGDPFRAGTPNGSAGHVMPDGIPVLAAGDGVVWSAQLTPHGHAVVIDHGPLKIATFYAHLEKLFVKETDRAKSQQRVKAGEPIGIVGFSPLDGEKLKHLHFEIWLGGPKDAIDPAPLLKTWNVIDDPRGTGAPRNAGFIYRPVGSRGEPYPDWVRELDGKSGVYVIRERQRDGSTEIVYVGESHTGRLYDTLTRHLQTWRRWKRFWKGQYGEGHDPGLTYDRDRVEIAVRLTSPSQALDEEARLIRRLKPRDNLIGQLEEAPF
jgi:hypothetical protein